MMPDVIYKLSAQAAGEPVHTAIGTFSSPNVNHVIVGYFGGHFIEGSLERRSFFRGTWHAGFPGGFDPYTFPNPERYGGIVPLPAGM